MRTALACETEWIESVVMVHLRGPLRLDTAPELRAAVCKCLAAEPGAVVVDTAGVRDVDDIALSVFPTLARAAAAWPGVELLVVAPDPDMRERLSAMAVSRHVKVVPDRAEALALVRKGARPPVARYTLPAGPAAVTEARAVAREVCSRGGLGDLADTAELIAVELVTNAVVHARPPYTFAIQARGRYLHLSVRDGSPTVPVRIGAEPPSGTGGRGLLLIEALSIAWGVVPGEDRKIVWATLPLRRRAHARGVSSR